MVRAVFRGRGRGRLRGHGFDSSWVRFAIPSEISAGFFGRTETGIVSVANGIASLMANSWRNNGAWPKQWVSWIHDNSRNFAKISSAPLSRVNVFTPAGVNTSWAQRVAPMTLANKVYATI